MSDRRVIEQYWADPKTVSLIDQNLRRLETDFVLSRLGGDEDFADFGCGGGESTVEYARRVATCLALEQSAHLRSKAEERFAQAGLENVELVAGNVLDLSAWRGCFNAVSTQRVVINFMSWEEQQQVLHNIWETLRPGGMYIAIENTFEGFEAMNAVRRQVGLANIKLHDWHNYFLHRERFLEFMDGRFVLESTHTFNLYYLLTRVFVNMFANFEGYGAIAKKDDIFEGADAAARTLYEQFGHRLSFDLDKGDSFGPIQGFVFRRAA